jgi:hypothetical protein
VYTAPLLRKPSTVASNPRTRCASSIGSSESPELRTPLPQAITMAVRRRRAHTVSAVSARAAPVPSAIPLARPQHPACVQGGSVALR